MNNAISNRTSMAKSGTAFTQADTISYGYNDRSEVTAATALNDLNYVYAYQFDNIGNRLTATEAGTSKAYTANQLNQYTAITNPSQDPTYDDDGNMLNDGTWTFTWDAENRMKSATNGTQTLEFTYDYLSRRVEKKVYSGLTLNTHKRFVYDNYLQIEELDALDSNNILKKRIWSGDKLISEIQGATAYYAIGDANKNITEYLDASGAVKTHYEYSPFGKITVKTGDMQDSFDYRFSSEYFDTETGLVYYNYRYYSPDLGRWLSRDPIEEEGGYNLYCMVKNNSINLMDLLGNCPTAGEDSLKEGTLPIELQRMLELLGISMDLGIYLKLSIGIASLGYERGSNPISNTTYENFYASFANANTNMEFSYGREAPGLPKEIYTKRENYTDQYGYSHVSEVPIYESKGDVLNRNNATFEFKAEAKVEKSVSLLFAKVGTTITAKKAFDYMNHLSNKTKKALDSLLPKSLQNPAWRYQREQQNE